MVRRYTQRLEYTTSDAEYQYPDIVEKIEAEVSRYELGVDLESS